MLVSHSTKRITVDDLIAQLQMLSAEGRGKQRVYIRTDGHDWCPGLAVISSHHTTSMGHVVLSGEDWDEVMKAEITP